MIQQLSINDMHAVLAIDSEVLNSNWSETLYIQELMDFNTIAFVAKVDGDVLGFVVGKMLVDSSDLYQVAVASRAQHAGIGLALMQAFWDEVKLRNGKEIILEVNAKHTDIIDFYKKFGFRRLYIRRNYYGRNRDAWVMKKEGD